ncbi:MAG: folate family ECF transporter S component [Erysipelotrichales bacterium]|nr:folate family ECF transporter S component [Erysipelotrichales bacterium]
MWKDSLLELRKTKSIVTAGLLSALNVVLGMFQIIVIPQVLIFSFNFLSVSALGFLCGPFVCGIAGAICDILKFLFNPTGEFFLGFTLNEFLGGFIYGLVLYKKKVSLTRCFFAKAIVNIVINILLTPLWLNILYGKAWIAYASTRLIKNIVGLPIESFVMYYILKLVSRIRQKN